MSDNKYIIDKDSLTGIADAVRDKLGVGEATTDSQTGDIVYPEDKGYYLKQETVAKWKKSSTTDTWSGTGTEYVLRANVTEEQLFRVCNGVRPVYVKIDIVSTSTNHTILVENSLTSWSASNPIVTLPTSGRFFCQYVYSHSSYSTQFQQRTIPAVIFSFLDENQKIIIPENASNIVDESQNIDLLQESGERPIPFTIDDIQNKITNYLEKSPFASKVLSDAPGYSYQPSGWMPDSTARSDFFDVSQDSEVFVFSAGNRLRITTWNDITAPTNNTQTSSRNLCQSVYTLDGQYKSAAIVQTSGKKYLGVQKTNESLNGILCFVVPTTILQEVN